MPVWGGAGRHARARDVCNVVEELRRLLDSAGVASPRILAGHSYGGLVVRAYAARYPREVAGMVLVDPVGALEWSDPAPSSRRMLKLGIRLSRRGALLARLGVPRIAFGLLTGGARKLPKWIARATSGPGAGLIDRVVGQVQKLPQELRPAIQAHWCDPKCFLGMAGYLEALPESAAAVTRAGERCPSRHSADRPILRQRKRERAGGAPIAGAKLLARRYRNCIQQRALDPDRPSGCGD